LLSVHYVYIACGVSVLSLVVGYPGVNYALTTTTSPKLAERCAEILFYCRCICCETHVTVAGVICLWQRIASSFYPRKNATVLHDFAFVCASLQWFCRVRNCRCYQSYWYDWAL